MEPKPARTDQVIERLRQQRGRYKEISRLAGIPYSTLVKIAQGTIPNPGSRQIDALADLFEREAAAKATPAALVVNG